MEKSESESSADIQDQSELEKSDQSQNDFFPYDSGKVKSLRKQLRFQVSSSTVKDKQFKEGYVPSTEKDTSTVRKDTKPSEKVVQSRKKSKSFKDKDLLVKDIMESKQSQEDAFPINPEVIESLKKRLKSQSVLPSEDMQFKEKDTPSRRPSRIKDMSSTKKDMSSTEKDMSTRKKDTPPSEKDVQSSKKDSSSKEKSTFFKSKSLLLGEDDIKKESEQSQEDAFPINPEVVGSLKKRLKSQSVLPSEDMQFEEKDTPSRRPSRKKDMSSTEKDMSTRKKDTPPSEKDVQSSKKDSSSKEKSTFFKSKSLLLGEDDSMKESEQSQEDAFPINPELVESLKKRLQRQSLQPSEDMKFEDTPSKRKDMPSDKDEECESESETDERKDVGILPHISTQKIIVEEGLTRDLKEKSTSLAGSKGFVDDLLDKVLTKEELAQTTHAVPFARRRTLADRKQTLKEAESDIKTHFETALKASGPRQRKRKEDSFRRSAGSISSVGGPLRTKTDTLPEHLSHLKSEWSPTDEEPKVGYYQREESWVGSFVVGTDYWSEGMLHVHTEETVKFSMDKYHKSWYDMPISDDEDEGQGEFTAEEGELLSRKKIESMKVKKPEDADTVLAKDIPRKSDLKDDLPEKSEKDLREMFTEFAKTDDLAGMRSRLSLSSADKWLEKVGFLDHKNLTTIHTGFFFKTAGGTRYQGLSFEEFKNFIEMIRKVKNMPLYDTVNRLKLAYVGITYKDKKK